MASLGDWMEGARLRTLPAAAAPVIAGAGGAIGLGAFSWPRALLALTVALALQVGVNFANDYSDGVRGTDDQRVGPPRMTASGAVSPKTVLVAALASFAVAAIAGASLVVLSGRWWLIAAGVAAIAAAWFYTGGKHPYGYYGVAEIFVLIFFGYMATVGTTYVQSLSAPYQIWLVGTALGLMSCALLMINNLRDIPTDTEVGKRTLAVRVGDANARRIYDAYIAIAAICTWFATDNWWVRGVIVTWVFFTWLLTQPLRKGATGMKLLGPLRNTGLATLVLGIVAACGLAF